MPGVAKVSSIASGTHMYNRRDHENREESGIEKKYQKPEPKQLIAYRRLHVTLHRDRDFSKGKGRGRGRPLTSDIQHQRFFQL